MLLLLLLLWFVFFCLLFSKTSVCVRRTVIAPPNPFTEPLSSSRSHSFARSRGPVSFSLVRPFYVCSTGTELPRLPCVRLGRLNTALLFFDFPCVTRDRSAVAYGISFGARHPPPATSERRVRRPHFRQRPAASAAALGTRVRCINTRVRAEYLFAAYARRI